MATASKRDLPAICLLFGVIFSMGAVVFGFGWRLDFVARQDLRKISGVVRAVHHTNLPKAGSKIHIYIQDRTSLHHLTQDDLTSDVPELRTVRIGDSVIAYVKPDSFGRDLEWFWDLERDGHPILTYGDMRNHLLAKARRMRPLAYASALIAFGLLFAAVALRRRFGAWKSAT